MKSANSRSSADLDLAPMTCFTTSPPANRLMVGTIMTPYLRMDSGFSSVLSLTTSSRPAYSAAIASSTGPTWRQGPHHGAQYSTMTGRGLDRTSASKLASVTDLAALTGICSPQCVKTPCWRSACYLGPGWLGFGQVQCDAVVAAAVRAHPDQPAQPAGQRA